jgi:hypothetical protein
LVGSSSVSVAHALLDEHDGGGNFLCDSHASYAARCRARSDEQHKGSALSFEGKTPVIANTTRHKFHKYKP